MLAGVNAAEFRKRIIIGGLPRSGSSLLRVLLDASPTVIALAETAFFVKSLAYRQKRLRQSVSRLNRVLRLDEAQVLRILETSTDQIQCFDGLIAAYQTRHETSKSVWAEKTPRNCFRYTELWEMDPNIYFISTIRDGRDVVTSVVEGKEGYHCSIERYNDSMKTISSFQHDRHKVLRYEDLVSKPEVCLRSLFEFLAEEFNPEILTIYQRPSQTRDPTLMRQPNVTNPISTRSVGRWVAPEHRQRVKAFESNVEARQWNSRAGYDAAE